MGIALHWWEGPFYCEFKDDGDGWMLRIYTGRGLVWQQPVGSATAAWRCASELTLSLSSRVKEG